MVNNATPRVIINGFVDEEKTPITADVNIPAHLAIVPLLTRRGPTDLKILSSDALLKTYDPMSFDENGIYTTHQTILANKLLSTGNNICIKRIVPPTATKALIRLSVEIAPCEIPTYRRNSDGSLAYVNVGGFSTPDKIGTVNGTRVIWHLNPVYPEQIRGFAKAQVLNDYRNGDVASLSGGYLSRYLDGVDLKYATSTLYPIMDIECDNEGEWGNDIGLVIEPLVSKVATSSDYSLVTSLKTFLYKFKLIQRANNAAGFNVLQTGSGDVTFKAGFIATDVHPQTNQSLFIKNQLENQYINDLDIKDIGRVHVYTSHYNAVVDKLVNGYIHEGVLFSGEKDFDVVTGVADRYFAFSKESNMTLFNLLNGCDQDGMPYHASLYGTNQGFGGIEFSGNSPMYAVDGSDGLPTNDGQSGYYDVLKVYDDGVNDWLEDIVAGNTDLKDMARYPISAMWDSGFSLRIKKLMIALTSVRKDVMVVLGTYIQADYTGIVSTTPPPPVKPLISCVGGQQDAVLMISEDDLYDLEIDGIEDMKNLTLSEFLIRLQERGILAEIYTQPR